MLTEEVRNKNNLLASNFDLYKRLYPKDFLQKPTEEIVEESIIVPKTQKELQDIYNAFAQDGLLDFDTQLFDVNRSAHTGQGAPPYTHNSPDIDTQLAEALAAQTPGTFDDPEEFRPRMDNPPS